MGKYAASLSAIGGGGCNGTYVRSKKAYRLINWEKAKEKVTRARNRKLKLPLLL